MAAAPPMTTSRLFHESSLSTWSRTQASQSEEQKLVSSS
jgi:hypothetical protein